MAKQTESDEKFFAGEHVSSVMPEEKTAEDKQGNYATVADRVGLKFEVDFVVLGGAANTLLYNGSDRCHQEQNVQAVV